MFKTGDKIKVVKPVNPLKTSLIGQTGTILNVYDYDVYDIISDDDNKKIEEFYWHGYELELISEFNSWGNFSKKDLKDGMILVDRSGHEYILFREILHKDEYEHIPLSEYEEDLTFGEEYYYDDDIMTIKYPDGEIVWERKITKLELKEKILNILDNFMRTGYVEFLEEDMTEVIENYIKFKI